MTNIELLEELVGRALALLDEIEMAVPTGSPTMRIQGLKTTAEEVLDTIIEECREGLAEEYAAEQVDRIIDLMKEKEAN